MAIGRDGLPIISHYDLSFDILRVTHCGNPSCTDGNVTVAADTKVGVGTFSSIAIGADGLPVISHRDSALKALRVTHCGNVACTTGNVSTTVDDQANSVGVDSSIAIGADGLPVISHLDQTAGTLRVTHCGSLTCATGNVSTTVDDVANFVGQYSSIAIGTDGLPIISHHDYTASALRVTHCGNAACTSGNSSTTVDDADNEVGIFGTAIAIGADGVPVIGYYDSTAHSLRVMHCGNTTCTAGNTVRLVGDPTNAVGFDPTIAIGGDGLPVISHLDLTAHRVRITKCGSLGC
jgi:hypothetical protein